MGEGQGLAMNVNLVVVHGKPPGKALEFPCGEFVFGRGSECHVRPNSSWVSRQHCILRVTEKTVQLCDLGSTNGTLINGKRLIGERDLAHGDKIQIGPLVFEVRLSTGQSETCNCAFDSNETLAPGEEKEAADMSTKPTEHLLKTPPPL
jgi:pSer/pThr/pTyr-binding forkhead associated (FHA) protein